MAVTNASKKAPPRKNRPIVIGGLAAMLLGRYRAAGAKSFTARQMATEFPAFNESELLHAVGELIDKMLVTQSGHDARAVYSLTEQGNTCRIAVA